MFTYSKPHGTNLPAILYNYIALCLDCLIGCSFDFIIYSLRLLVPLPAFFPGFSDAIVVCGTGHFLQSEFSIHALGEVDLLPSVFQWNLIPMDKNSFSSASGSATPGSSGQGFLTPSLSTTPAHSGLQIASGGSTAVEGTGDRSAAGPASTSSGGASGASSTNRTTGFSGKTVIVNQRQVNWIYFIRYSEMDFIAGAFLHSRNIGSFDWLIELIWIELNIR